MTIKMKNKLKKVAELFGWILFFFIIFLGIDYCMAFFVELDFVSMAFGQALVFGSMKTFCPKFLN